MLSCTMAVPAKRKAAALDPEVKRVFHGCLGEEEDERQERV